MIKLFNIDSVVTGRVVNSVPNQGYFFVQNCDPKQIFCHINDGGRLDVTERCEVTFTPEEILMPCKGNVVALVRLSTNPEEKKYTKASMWVPIDQWRNSSRYIESLNSYYRAVGYNHTVNGEYTGHGETIMATDTLRHLIRQVRSGQVDIAGNTFESELNGFVYKNDIAWERLIKGKWCNCSCPLPKYLQR